MLDETCFFEIPIYRVCETLFHSEFDRDQAAHLDKQRRLGRVEPGQLPDWELQVKDGFWKSYGMPWQFNQVVGWLRLFRLGHQLRGDLWLSSAKRFLRVPGHKRFELVGKAFEIWVESKSTDEAIVSRLRDEFKELERNYSSRKLTLDLECFDSIAPFIRWTDFASAGRP